MLVGRDPECGALDRLLSQARAGVSGVLALIGEPGIGKTALLEYAVEHSDGMRVLRARGMESEAVVPFGGLLELLRPVLAHLDRVPGPQAEALAAALALQPAGAHSRFAVGAATLSLLAAAADESPVLIVLDDVHWLDGSSAEALLFAIRRLVADPIAVLLAVRDGELSLLDGSDLPELRLTGLDRTSIRELLAGDTRALAPGITDRLHELTGGNPLALLEVGVDALRLGGGQIQEVIPVTARTARAFLGRSRSLPERARRMLVLAAASDDGDLATLFKAALLLGLEADDLSAAERVELVDLGLASVRFRHPLVRSTIYSDARPDWRRDAHGALASSLSERDVDRRAWHRSAATIGTDESTSTALEEAGMRARSRGGYTEAATAFERAARLTSDESRTAELLYQAADTAWLAGLTERSSMLVEEVVASTPDPAVTARVGHLRGHLAMRKGPVMVGHAMLVEAAETAAADGEPELAVAMLAEGANACFYAGDSAALTVTADRANQLTPDDASPRTLFLVAMVSGMALVIRGDGEQGTALIRRAVDSFEATSQLYGDVRLLPWAVIGALWVRNTATGVSIIDRAVTTAREQVAIGTLPYLLHHVARHQATSDHWTAAGANYHEAVRLSREMRQRTDLAAGLAGLACLEARQGRNDCVLHAAEARELCAELGAGMYDIWATTALADLELGRGRAAEALDLLLEQQRALHRLQIVDADLSPGPELVEVHLRLGNRRAAIDAAEVFDRLAVAKGQPWSLARSERCRGMLAPEETFSAHFDRALELHEVTPDAFESARTHLIFGARLRRARQRVRSRQEIRHALELFDRLGATPWVDQASAELAATGETARRRHVGTVNELTPQELQVALLLAKGSTTREAASALFLSPKTIEYHLGHIYRKLGIHSRSELTAEMDSGE